MDYSQITVVGMFRRFLGIEELSELKIVICISLAFVEGGLEPQHFTYDKLRVMSGLCRDSVRRGLRNALAHGRIKTVRRGARRYYMPNIEEWK